MRTSSAPGSAPRGRSGHRILLTLLLCACGPQGEETNVPRAAVSAAQTDATCQTPALALTPRGGQSWGELIAAMNTHGVTFPATPENTAAAPVKLCPTCDTVTLELRSTNRTCGTDTASVRQSPRLLAMMIPKRNVAAQAEWPAFSVGDTILMFSQGMGGDALVAYRQDSTVALAPRGSWRFWYCADGHTPTGPRTEWKPRNPAAGTAAQTTDGGTYGWMACISGCCEFYTPGEEVIETPEVADPNAPDTVGAGRNQGQTGGRPPWCPARG